MGQLFDEYPVLLVLPEIILMIVLAIGIIWWTQSRNKQKPGNGPGNTPGSRPGNRPESGRGNQQRHKRGR